MFTFNSFDCRGWGMLKTLRLALFILLIATTMIGGYAQTADGRAMIHQAAIRSITGAVTIQDGGVGPWRRARVGDSLRAADRVRTGAAAGCRIMIGDIGLVELGERSEGRLGSMRQLRERNGVRDVIAIHLERGASRQSIIRRPGRISEFRVITPVAVAGIRGTCFETALDEEVKNLNCVVLEGTVELTGTVVGAAWSRTVSAGMQCGVASGRVPAEPTAADPSALRRLAPLREAVQQADALPVTSEKLPGDVDLKAEPAELSFVTESAVEKTFSGRTLTLIGATAAKNVRISFAGVAAGQDVVLEVGKDFSFRRLFETYPFSIEGTGRVSASGDRTTVTFTRLRVAYVEETAMDLYEITCVVTLDPGGVGTFRLVITPGEEVEVE